MPKLCQLQTQQRAFVLSFFVCGISQAKDCGELLRMVLNTSSLKARLEAPVSQPSPPAFLSVLHAAQRSSPRPWLGYGEELVFHGVHAGGIKSSSEAEAFEKKTSGLFEALDNMGRKIVALSKEDNLSEWDANDIDRVTAVTKQLFSQLGFKSIKENGDGKLVFELRELAKFRGYESLKEIPSSFRVVVDPAPVNFHEKNRSLLLNRSTGSVVETADGAVEVHMPFQRLIMSAKRDGKDRYRFLEVDQVLEALTSHFEKQLPRATLKWTKADGNARVSTMAEEALFDSLLKVKRGLRHLQNETLLIQNRSSLNLSPEFMKLVRSQERRDESWTSLLRSTSGELRLMLGDLNTFRVNFKNQLVGHRSTLSSLVKKLEVTRDLSVENGELVWKLGQGEKIFAKLAQDGTSFEIATETARGQSATIVVPIPKSLRGVDLNNAPEREKLDAHIRRTVNELLSELESKFLLVDNLEALIRDTRNFSNRLRQNGNPPTEITPLVNELFGRYTKALEALQWPSTVATPPEASVEPLPKKPWHSN